MLRRRERASPQQLLFIICGDDTNSVREYAAFRFPKEPKKYSQLYRMDIWAGHFETTLAGVKSALGRLGIDTVILAVTGSSNGFAEHIAGFAKGHPNDLVIEVRQFIVADESIVIHLPNVFVWTEKQEPKKWWQFR